MAVGMGEPNLLETAMRRPWVGWGVKVEKMGELAIEVEGEEGEDDVVDRADNGGVEERDDMASGDPYECPSVPNVVATAVMGEPGRDDMRT
jgi:hypothetical protein